MPATIPRKRVFSLTEAEYRRLGEEYAGLCTACGEEASGVEPDAERYQCESCGQRAVYGIEELLIRGQVEITG